MIQPPIILDSAFFDSSFAIYIWRRGEQVLYVGMSGNVLSRIASHNIVNRIEPFQKEDTIEIRRFTTCYTWQDVEAEEIRLIKELQPKYNRAHTHGEFKSGAKQRPDMKPLSERYAEM